MKLQKVERDQTAVVEPEIRSYALSVEEVGRIIDAGKPLDSDDLDNREPVEVFPGEMLGRLRETPEPGIPMPPSIGDRIFPPVISTQRVFCFCLGYVWCLVGGRYILKCRYFCIPTLFTT